MTEVTTLVIMAIVLIIVTAVITYKFVKGRYEARIILVQSREQDRIKEATEQARKQSNKTQRSVLKGKIVEQLAPLLKEFTAQYNPSEAKFMGDPIDYIIYKNKDNDEPIEVILLDVKTGQARLTPTQRRIEDAVNQGRVKFETLRISDIPQPD